MGKHDDNGSYPHDCYPDRRKVADRRERDRDELGLDRERRRFEDRVAGLGAFGLPVVLSEDVPRGVAVMVSARPRRPFPEDPHGMARDEVLRRPYARPLSPTRAEFVRRLVEAAERPPLLTPSSHGLLQMPEPRHFADVPRRNVEEIRRPQRVTDAHRRDVLRLLGFGALTFRAICDRYDYEASIGRSVDRGLVRRTLRSLIDRGEVMAVKTRRPPQHLVGRKGKSKHERKPMTVYAVTAGAVALPGWAAGVPSRVALEDHVLALLVVSADLSNTGRTVLTCSSEAQAARVMAEAKRILSSPTWTRP